RRSHPREAALAARARSAAARRCPHREPGGALMAAEKAASPVGWLFVAPALSMIALFFVAPVLAALALSFTDFDIYALADLRNVRFVGLGNYVNLLETPLFWRALGNTLFFVAIGVPTSIALSLGSAMLLNARLARLKATFRTALFAPVVTTLVAVAVIWTYLLHTR